MTNPADSAPKKERSIKRIGAKEFMDLGLLQEVNRKVLHPLGLALEVVIKDDGSVEFGGVWDCRDDKEGIYFDPLDPAKLGNILAMEIERRKDRVKALGYWIQGEKP